MSQNRRNTRRRAARQDQGDSEQSLFVPTKKHDQYQRWSQDEHARYVQYLEQHLEDFTIQRGRKRKNLFMRMSQEIQCHKSNEQCRTHHEKMLKKYSSIENIIKNFKEPDSVIHHVQPPPQPRFELTGPFKSNIRPIEIIQMGVQQKNQFSKNQEKKNEFHGQKVLKNSLMEQEKRAVNPKVINMPFEDNDSGNSKPADLCNLDIDLPYSIVDNENANIMMLSINTPNVVAMNPLNSLDYWNRSVEPFPSPGVPNIFIARQRY